MSVILAISGISFLVVIGASYLALKNTKSEESKIINQILIKYPQNPRYYG